MGAPQGPNGPDPKSVCGRPDRLPVRASQLARHLLGIAHRPARLCRIGS